MVLEKRKERRIRVSLPITILYQDKRKVLGKIENMSRLGTYAEINKEIRIGTDIEIILTIPVYTKDLSLSGKIRCKGKIFRCNLLREAESQKYYGIGIFFTEFLEQDDKDKLSKYIDFLILNEDRNIKKGLKQWRAKRGKVLGKGHV
ncbi:MAG: PilZ domain-containing protein [Candidatus Omnitrophica bacterium]|nr:PilZ domain-containing protein [Candidatus Omnitrophota bacterium]MBU4473238.1 PilZ domain-containing protein [Candidatus Omnitrophota bacterium]MCG2706535.1 PilZ domain-containing protein [Candidatus Omnitrophota bacterium]